MQSDPADLAALLEEIEAAFEEGTDDSNRSRQLELFAEFLAHLGSGTVRAAEPSSTAPHGWRVNTWVKRGILLGFRVGRVENRDLDDYFRFADKDTFPPRRNPLLPGARIVPGGSAVREGAYLGERVTCMPPMYVNVGAWVGANTMVDSHVLVGSCAQVGERCHLSAGAQIGGVLEPVGAMPVVIEDDVLIGGNCGVYEGTIVKRRAVVGAGVILTGSTPVYDTIQGEVRRATTSSPLVIPEGAVVVPGSRPIKAGRGKQWGLHLQTPVIVKYRDQATERRAELEEALR